MTTYQEGGRGRKQCPKCEVYLGVRVAECECGYEFEKADNKKDEAAACPHTLKARQEAGLFGWTGPITLTPAGECPVKLKSTDEESVHAWCERTISIRQQEERSFLCSEAMTYFARDFYDYFGADYKVVKNHIATYFGSPPESPIPVYSAEAEADAEIEEDAEVEIDDDIMSQPYKPAKGDKGDLEKAIKDAKTSEDDIDL